MNAATTKQVERALSTGDAEYIAATIASIHRASGTKVRKELDLVIDRANIWDKFTMVNGELVASHLI